MAEQDALGAAKFGNGLYVKDFPVKLRVLTRDPMVYNSDYKGQPSTHYVFVVYNFDTQSVQVLDKGAGTVQQLQEINADPDYGSDLRGIDVKIKTNGESGKNIRYIVNPIGEPHELTKEEVKRIYEAALDLEKTVKRNNPGAIRLSEVNAGKQPTGDDEANGPTTEPTIEDVGDEPISLDDIPF